ncbi:hypothetical protein BDV38DRAFT_289097 [Aspergillus pseudotamarii]|uniref:Uncharacterized protein n=1 Tax=Aspergillus pseudotamarii TaxID=132259 RepID=A0A5N6SAK4_ASPPS|nr:uncharacterized protein BDV38DRAFT_289097 [Aspergillus pseudotamarii]KAE8130997.1 hypothetical protein BDV38DRAFT_289097 [Aspergillus pseudotamarii]
MDISSLPDDYFLTADVFTKKLYRASSGLGAHGFKGEQARLYWAEAGEVVSRHIDLRVGDLRETLQENVPAVDIPLLDNDLGSYGAARFESCPAVSPAWRSCNHR